MNNILKGISSILDVFAPGSSYKERLSDIGIFESDFDAMKSDWVQIGRVLSEVMNNHIPLDIQDHYFEYKRWLCDKENILENEITNKHNEQKQYLNERIEEFEQMLYKIKQVLLKEIIPTINNSYKFKDKHLQNQLSLDFTNYQEVAKG